MSLCQAQEMHIWTKRTAHELFVLLSTFLTSIGFMKRKPDQCLYYLHEDDENYLFVITHVYDLSTVRVGRTFYYLETQLKEMFGTPDINFSIRQRHTTEFTFTSRTTKIFTLSMMQIKVKNLIILAHQLHGERRCQGLVARMQRVCFVMKK